ncbi:phage tail protein [Xenorhabdus griffiniae]|uniref:phage tail-collar fiber domain-containing protein n=1 Tax=Xenorhabdus griffiniae TaxID=351672 RepID=UPI002358FF6D|nr:phage tail protein [Xenorhabdus griffiniae]MDC9606109.1 phage tail protein [Xenorhabdus griffiniae]
MSSVITLDFENWKAQQVAAGNPVVLDEFVFAYVPDLDPTQPISRNEKLPAQSHIVHRQAVNKTGLASENAVAYSVTLGTEAGNFDFNWIGLINKASGVMGMITHAPTQKKIKTANGLQGNVLTRSFLLEFDGAAKETAITTTAETWQIDFTARLTGIDEMQRLINTDSYGEAAFFGDGFAVVRQGEQYTVKKGLAYVGGLRGMLEFDQTLNSQRNTRVYADFSYQGNLVSQWQTVVKITVANELKNDIDAAGYPHYVFAVAQIDSDGNVIDLRPTGSLNARNIVVLNSELDSVKQGYATKVALFSGLNEKQGKGDYATNSVLNAAINAVNNNVNNRLEKSKNGSDIFDKALFARNIGAYPQTGGEINGNVNAAGWLVGDDLYERFDNGDWAAVYSKKHPPPRRMSEPLVRLGRVLLEATLNYNTICHQVFIR